MTFDQIQKPLSAIITYLRQIANFTNPSECCAAITSAGASTSIPVGYSTVSIVQTSALGTVVIGMSDGTSFILTVQGEVLVHSAGVGKFLPKYIISSPDGGTWKWTAVK